MREEEKGVQGEERRKGRGEKGGEKEREKERVVPYPASM
jgi:hypothetical protein